MRAASPCPAADGRAIAGLTFVILSVVLVLSGASVGRTIAAGAQAPFSPMAILVRGATIWTMGPAGTLSKGDLVVSGGRIVEVGGTIEPPAGALVIDGAGKHVTPGIIDCHSHTAIDGNVNEGTHNITAEVRIGDVVDSENVNIYRQLAGGTTTVNALHGSANSIGGQNAVLRWKWGRPATEMLFAGSPQGIKFALGENPKQSNWIDPFDRYPKSRMGVEESIRAAFLAARENRSAWEREKTWLAKKDEHHVPPRRDFQLDALNEILEGKRFVHSHCYRQDEILMLLRLAESMGFRVRTFQHVLEGYKVADEMAAHGAGGSTFSDWWGFKIEAYEAIPYNATLMTRRGVLSSINSDSAELARHLNLEAAKSMKFGGLTPIESLALVTINPAKQLGIDARVGSLETGKDADFVVWNGDPLSIYSSVESTWIEGVKYFDRIEDIEKRKALEQERGTLVAKVKNPPKKEGEKKEGEKTAGVGREGEKGDEETRERASGEGEARTGAGKGDRAAEPGGAKAEVKGPDEKATQVSKPAEPSAADKTPAPGAKAAPAPITEAQVGPVFPPVHPAPVPETGPVTALMGVTVHTVSGAVIPNGVVLIRAGKIAAVGHDLTVSPGATRVDLSGRHLYPSMIDANTQLGIVEINSVKGTVDTTETGKINPDIRVEVAVNAASESIPVTRAGGVLVALTVPQGALLRGTSALLRLDGWTWEEMTLRAPVAMHLAWPSVSVPVNWWEPKKSEEEIRKERDEALKDVKTALAAARAYLKAKRAAERGEAARPEVDSRSEAMIPVLEGKIPFMVEANDVRQIRGAVEWAEKEKISLIVSGGRDAWRVSDLLAKKHVPVVLGPVLSLPAHEDDPYDAAYASPAKLSAAGVLFALSAGGATNVRILPYQAGTAAAFGLPREEALRSVTLYPARILGVEDRLGSIEPGKDATFFACDGDPLETRTQILAAWIDGRPVSLDNKHRRLYEQYRGRPLPASTPN